MRTLGLTTTLSLLLPLSIAGQSIPSGGYSLADGTDPIFWPTSQLGTAGDFHRVVFGSFFGDCSPDGAALVGDKAVLLYHPAVLRNVYEVQTGVLQIEAVKPPLPEDPWGLAMAKSDGIWLYRHGSTLVQIASGSAWSGLTMLRSGNFDSAGFGDLVGASGSSIHVLVHDGSSWSSQGSTSTLGTVFAVVPIHWDTDGEEEIGILTSAGAEVRDPDGTLIDFFTGANSGGLLAPIPLMSGYGQGRLAWSFPTTGGHLLLVCHPGGSRTNCGTFLNLPATLSSAIYNAGHGSRRVDLLTMGSNDMNARWFMHEGSGNPYTANSLPDVTHGVGGAAPVGSCEPAFRDSSGDGVPDLLIGRPTEDAFYYVAGKEKAFGATPENPPGGDAFVQADIDLVEGEGKPYFRTHLDLPNNHGYGYVHMQVWRSADGDELVPVAIANDLFDILETDPEEEFAPVVAGTDMQIAVELPNEDDDDCVLDNAYYVILRLVDAETNPLRITRASGSIDGAFAHSSNLVAKITPPGGSTTLLLGICPETLSPSFLTNPRWAVVSPPYVPSAGPLLPGSNPFQ